mmetsp:Transcript_37798/g.113041  ORF Transcript_37798/g.113041 Transcript_37798/m.113041 type:complete len:99 (-) Transcript_37798:344-640(-)
MRWQKNRQYRRRNPDWPSPNPHNMERLNEHARSNYSVRKMSNGVNASVGVIGHVRCHRGEAEHKSGNPFARPKERDRKEKEKAGESNGEMRSVTPRER